jgi:CheY-like chemotaxis protein
MAEAALESGQKILIIGGTNGQFQPLHKALEGLAEFVHAPSGISAVELLKKTEFAGVIVAAEHRALLPDFVDRWRALEILARLPDGVVLVDMDLSILWASSRFAELVRRTEVAGENLYHVLGGVEAADNDYCPFHAALSTGRTSQATLRLKDGRHFEMQAAPVDAGSTENRHLIVVARDVSEAVQNERRMVEIHQAGLMLSDLTPDELRNMSVDDRIELLKQNILDCIKNVLHFDVVEIRLLDGKTGRLEPLLSVGMDPEAAARCLYARQQDNGVTGYVASTGKSYLCGDTSNDPLYLRGAANAKSSLTLPLVLHEDTIGTFNVESPKPNAFTKRELQFLEIFTQEVAAALNTLELLVAEKASTAAASVFAIQRAIALPIDDILTDAAYVAENSIGHNADVTERLQRILTRARDIKRSIRAVGQSIVPVDSLSLGEDGEDRPILRGRQILVVDADESVRQAARDFLDRYGCNVDTAHDAAAAVSIVRNSSANVKYDCVISDIRLPDMSGYQLMLRLRTLMNPVPLVLMTGFGWDPGHSIVNARKEGLHPKGILYKPFRLDNLLETVELIIRATDEQAD